MYVRPRAHVHTLKLRFIGKSKVHFPVPHPSSPSPPAGNGSSRAVPVHHRAASPTRCIGLHWAAACMQLRRRIRGRDSGRVVSPGVGITSTRPLPLSPPIMCQKKGRIEDSEMKVRCNLLRLKNRNSRYISRGNFSFLLSSFFYLEGKFSHSSVTKKIPFSTQQYLYHPYRVAA